MENKHFYISCHIFILGDNLMATKKVSVNVSSWYDKAVELSKQLPNIRDKLRTDFPSYKVVERFARIWVVAFVVSGAYYKLTGDITLLDALKTSAINGVYAGGMASIDKLREYFPERVALAKRKK